MVDIPFIPLRDHIPKSLLSNTLSFNDTIHLARRCIGDTPQLKIDLNSNELCIQNQTIKLDPIQLCFYAWLCERAKKRPQKEDHWVNVLDEDHRKEFNAFYKKHMKHEGHFERHVERYAHSQNTIDLGEFSTYKSRVNGKIKACLGLGSLPFEIKKEKNKQHKTNFYFVDLKDEAITIIYSKH